MRYGLPEQAAQNTGGAQCGRYLKALDKIVINSTDVVIHTNQLQATEPAAA